MSTIASRWGNGRYVMRPSILASMLQEVETGPDDVVLVIGCGTGYGIAAMAKLASTVVAVESNADLASRAARNLTESRHRQCRRDRRADGRGVPDPGAVRHHLFQRCGGHDPGFDRRAVGRGGDV